jgi:hypothetical protein
MGKDEEEEASLVSLSRQEFSSFFFFTYAKNVVIVF